MKSGDHAMNARAWGRLFASGALALAAALAGAGQAAAQAVCFLHFDNNATGTSSRVSLSLNGLAFTVPLSSGDTDDQVRDKVRDAVRMEGFSAVSVGDTSLVVSSQAGAALSGCEVSTNDPSLQVFDLLVTPPVMVIDLDFTTDTPVDDVGAVGGTLQATPNGVNVTVPYGSGDSDSLVAYRLFLAIQAAGFGCWWSGASVVVLYQGTSTPVTTGNVVELTADPALNEVVVFPCHVGAVSPLSGPRLNPPLVTIQGKGFLQGSTVRFAGSPATAVSITDSIITCRPPTTVACATTTATVRIDNASGRPAGERSGAYAFNPCPVVTGFTPTTGHVSGGTLVTVQGQRFTATGAGSTSVLFGSVPATGVMVLNDGEINCRSPGVPCPTSVSVTVRNDNGSATASSTFTYTGPTCGGGGGGPVPATGPVTLALLVAGVLAAGVVILRRAA
jgi:hypothetical protein